MFNRIVEPLYAEINRRVHYEGPTVWLKIQTVEYAPLLGVETLAKELTAAIRIMQSSSNELSTPVSDSTKSK